MSGTFGRSAVFVVGVAAALSGCAVPKSNYPTIESGGYTWTIQLESEGGNRIQANGAPNRQQATDAANTLCKKHGRVAQFAKHDPMPLLGFQNYTFNCVK